MLPTAPSPTASHVAAWISRDVQAGNIALDQLAPAAVAAHFQCSPEVATQAIALCREQAVSAAEALGQDTAHLRGALSAHGAPATMGGAAHRLNTAAALQSRLAQPEQLLQQAGAAYANGDLPAEANLLAQYWNGFAGKEVLDSQLMPSAEGIVAIPTGTPQRALLERMSQAPQYQRLQMLREFVRPRQQPQESLTSKLMGGLKQGLSHLAANPTAAIGLMNPMLGMMMSMQQQQAAAQPPLTQPAVAQQPVPQSLTDRLTQIAQGAYQQHAAMNRGYPAAAQLMPLIQRFAAATDTLDAKLRERLQPAFESALQRGDGDGIFALTTRSEALAQASYEAKMKAALGE